MPCLSLRLTCVFQLGERTVVDQLKDIFSCALICYSLLFASDEVHRLSTELNGRCSRTKKPLFLKSLKLKLTKESLKVTQAEAEEGKSELGVANQATFFHHRIAVCNSKKMIDDQLIVTPVT